MVRFGWKGASGMDSFVAWAAANWKLTYLLYSVVVAAALAYAVPKAIKGKSTAYIAAAAWGVILFALLLLFLLGASDSPTQFLVLFGFGVFGAALGYLTGVWLAPSSLSEESRFVKAQSLVATLLAGAFGTKLLSFWDTLTTGDRKLILEPAYFLPVICGLVGYFVALAAFYTIRSTDGGQVKITALDKQFVPWTDSAGKAHDNGVPAGARIQFSGAADFEDDISVLWDLKPKDNSPAAPPLPAGTINANGLLTVPDSAWVAANPTFLDWAVVVTSNRDRSRFASFDIHFV